MRFKLNGCDISFIAEAPEYMTLREFVDLADHIKPDWCACGVRHLTESEADADYLSTEIIFDFGVVKKANEGVSCRIEGSKDGLCYKVEPPTGF